MTPGRHEKWKSDIVFEDSGQGPKVGGDKLVVVGNLDEVVSLEGGQSEGFPVWHVSPMNLDDSVSQPCYSQLASWRGACGWLEGVCGRLEGVLDHVDSAGAPPTGLGVSPSIGWSKPKFQEEGMEEDNQVIKIRLDLIVKLEKKLREPRSLLLHQIGNIFLGQIGNIFTLF